MPRRVQTPEEKEIARQKRLEHEENKGPQSGCINQKYMLKSMHDEGIDREIIVRMCVLISRKSMLRSMHNEGPTRSKCELINQKFMLRSMHKEGPTRSNKELDVRMYGLISQKSMLKSMHDEGLTRSK